MSTDRAPERWPSNSSEAVQFLSRAFRHQMSREVPASVTNPVLDILVDAQTACLDAMYKEAA